MVSSSTDSQLDRPFSSLVLHTAVLGKKTKQVLEKCPFQRHLKKMMMTRSGGASVTGQSGFFFSFRSGDRSAMLEQGDTSGLPPQVLYLITLRLNSLFGWVPFRLSNDDDCVVRWGWTNLFKYEKKKYLSLVPPSVKKSFRTHSYFYDSHFHFLPVGNPILCFENTEITISHFILPAIETNKKLKLIEALKKYFF